MEKMIRVVPKRPLVWGDKRLPAGIEVELPEDAAQALTAAGDVQPAPEKPSATGKEK